LSMLYSPLAGIGDGPRDGVAVTTELGLGREVGVVVGVGGGRSGRIHPRSAR
jgi:hypothetical protein